MTLADFSLPPEIMLQAACGMEEPLDVLTRHFDNGARAKALLANPVFQKQLEAKQAELLQGGVTTRLKAAMMAHDLLDDLFLRGKSSQTATSAVIDITKTLAKLGDLEPKQTVQAGGNSGFSIQIVLPGGQAPVEIGVKPKEIEINDVFEGDFAEVVREETSPLADLDRDF